MKIQKTTTQINKEFDDMFDEDFFGLHYRFCEFADEEKNNLCDEMKITLKRRIKQFISFAREEAKEELKEELYKKMTKIPTQLNGTNYYMISEDLIKNY